MQKKFLPALIVSLLAFIIYMLTLAPSVLFIDSGELATVAATLGIAHPTGYPLFTLVGYVFSHLPIGGTAVWRLNVMAAFFCALGAGVMVMLARLILSEISNAIAARKIISKQKSKSPTVEPENISSDVSSRAILAGSVFAGLMLAYSQTFWSQATAVEVYALHCFLVPLSIYCFLRYCFSKPEKIFSSWGILWSVVWGLSFTNHMTTILLIPAFTWFFFRTFGFNGKAFLRGVLLLLPFAAGLSLYAYLPIRAAQHPLENWGNPVNMENFIRHWTGHQYQVWMFTSFDAAGKQLKYFLGDLPTEFGLIGLIPILCGVVALFVYHRNMFWFVAVLFVSCVFYSINYDIHDIDSYFLLAYIASALFCGAAAWWMMRTTSLRQIALPALAACVVLNVAGHYRDNDESKDVLVHDYALNLLNGLPPNAIIVSWQWDFFVAASMYFQQVEHVRPDVTVIDKELLRRTWYIDQLEYAHPELYARSKNEMVAFRASLVKFENDDPYDAMEIESQYRGLIKSIAEKNFSDHPIFVTAELEKEYTDGFLRVPEGLAYKLCLTDDTLPVPFPNWTYHDIARRNYYTDKIREMYIFTAATRAKYLFEHGKYADAEQYFEYALKFQPKIPATDGNPTSAALNRTIQQIITSRDECKTKIALSR